MKRSLHLTARKSIPPGAALSCQPTKPTDLGFRCLNTVGSRPFPKPRRWFTLCLTLHLSVALQMSPMARGENWIDAQVRETVVDPGRYRINIAIGLAVSSTRNGCRVAKVEGDSAHGYTVRLDGKAGKRYDEIDAATPVFSTEGNSVAYAARRGAEWMWVINDIEEPAFQKLTATSFAFSANGKHHAYIAIPSPRCTVLMVDGQAKSQGSEDTIMPADLMPLFSADGTRLAYVEVQPARKQMRLHIDDQPGPWLDEIAMVQSTGFGAFTSHAINGRIPFPTRQQPMIPSLCFSADGKQFAYGARIGRQWHQIINGTPSAGHDALGPGFLFSPDGRRHAYAARNGIINHIVLGYDYGIPVRSVNDWTLTFSPDGSRFAFAGIVGDRNGVWLDEQPFPTEASSTPFVQSGALHFSPDSKRLAYVGKGPDAQLHWMVDGKAGPGTKLGLGPLDFSADSAHFAYLLPRSTDCAIIVDGRVRATYETVPAGPVFRPNGVIELLAVKDDVLQKVQVMGY